MRDLITVIVAYDRAELLDIASVTSTFEIANLLGARRRYQLVLATPGGRAIQLHSGLTLGGHQPLERVREPIDTLIVSGGIGHDDAAADPRLVGHVRRLARRARRVASVCTGTSVLAAAGLLDGRRVTTHWEYAAQLSARYPGLVVDPDPIYIRDGNLATAAGVTSALDLTLSFVEEDNGADVARRVSRQLVTYLQRPGNQAQMSIFTAGPAPSDDLVRRVVDHIISHLDGDLRAATLAARAGVGERHLTRLFLDHVGLPPGRYVRRARVEAAAHLLTTTSLPLSSVARRCGFRSAETLRQAFVGAYDTTPSRYRSLQSRTAG